MNLTCIWYDEPVLLIAQRISHNAQLSCGALVHNDNDSYNRCKFNYYDGSNAIVISKIAKDITITIKYVILTFIPVPIFTYIQIYRKNV